MHSYIILIIALCGLTPGFPYKIPKVRLEILSQGFRVSIPDEPGISEVFYAIEVNEMCPAYMDYVTEAKDGFWSTQDGKHILKPKDGLSIFLMVQHNEEIWKATEDVKIENDGSYTSVQLENYFLSQEFDKEKCSGNVENKKKKPCKVSKTVVLNAAGACEGDLVFEENFKESTDLNTFRWTYDIRLEEFVLFNDDKANNFIKDGILNIIPTAVNDNIRIGSIDLGEKCTAEVFRPRDCYSSHLKVLPPVHSTQIHTKNSFSFKYGRVEIRAKLPKGNWIVPYILLQPVSTSIDSDNPTQICIAYARGNEHHLNQENDEVGGSRLYGGIRFGQVGNRQVLMKTVLQRQHFGDDFHTYSLTWSETGISVAVDGVSYGEIKEYMDRFRTEFYIILGVYVGGHTDFFDNELKPWNNTDPKSASQFWRKRNQWKNSWNGNEALKIEYVKVYAI